MPFTEADLFNRALSRVGQPRLVVQAAKAVTSASAANPILVTANGHGYLDGDYVLISNFDMMTPVNNRIFQITSITTNTFTLVGEDGSTYTAETGGNVSKITLNKAIQVVFDAWKGVQGDGVRDEVLRAYPWNCAAKRVRLARLAAAKTITGATAANPIIITAAAHGYSNGDQIKLANLGGMIEVNDRFFTIASVTTNTFSLGEDGTAYTAYTSGGTAQKALRPLKPDFTWAARYSLPSDYLDLVSVEPRLTQQDYIVEGLELLTDITITVPIRYIARVKDPTAFDSLLISAFEARLASEIAEELTQSNTKAQALFESWQDILKTAKKSNTRERSPSNFETDVWDLARI